MVRLDLVNLILGVLIMATNQPRRSSYGAGKQNNDVVKMEDLPPTTHSMKRGDGEYPKGVFITEIETQYGTSLKVNVKAGGIAEGTYFINPKKDYKGL